MTMHLAVDDTIGSYRVAAAIRSGGMGSVYRCVHLQHGGAVALKTVSAPHESLLPAIRREIHALGRLRHPGVVRILESGTHRGVAWYAMELLGSRSLADIQRALGGPPNPDQLKDILTLIHRLCGALAYVHGEGIVHGDLKPDNVLIGADGRPVLIDFGLLTTFGDDPGRDGLDIRLHAAGTLATMAPEQFDGAEADARADLYALGCVLYELLTGRPPFVAASPVELQRARHEARPTPPSAFGLPRGFDELLLRLLAPRPRDRIGHAGDVAARLADLGAHVDADRGPRPRVYLYRPGLAGRARELDALTADVTTRFAASRGGMAFVVGESGVGKTRLVVELARRLAAAGARVLTGGCAALSGGAGLHALARPLQAIADRCRTAGAAETRRLLGAHGPLLARWQPALAGLPGQDDAAAPADLPPEAARARVSHALGATFEALCAEAPVLLVLDDLQWADEPTLAFLAKLAEHATLQRARLFVVGTARSDEIGEDLAALLAADLAARLDLDRLDEHGVRGMVAGMLAVPAPDDAFVRQICEHTEGNPFFVAEYLRAAVADGLLVRDARGRFQLAGDDAAALAALPLPRSLRALVAGRLDRLTADARRIADIAAVIGRAIDPALVARVAAIDEPTFLQAASELVARQVLEDSGAGLRFAHDKLREVAHDLLDAATRREIHRAVAGALDAAVTAPGAAEAAAHHWLAAGDDPRAAPLLLAAARLNLGECDNARAMASCRRALAILDAPTPDLIVHLHARRELWTDPLDPGAAAASADLAIVDEARRTAHRGLGDALTIVGRHDEALTHHAAALQHGAHAVARADALARMGAALFARGELLPAARHLEDALAQLGERLPTTRVGTLAAIAGGFALLCARLVLRRTITDVATRASEALRVRILNRLTYINYSFSLERAVATHLSALASAEQIADTRDAAETFAHHGPLFAGHWPSSARWHARRAVAVCRSEGHLAMQMTAEFMAGMCFTFQARWDDALTHFRAAIALYPRVGDLLVLQTAHENLGYALLYRGDFADALAESSRALELATRAGDIRGQCNAGTHAALSCLRLGDVAGARRLADAVDAHLAALDDHVVRCIVHILHGHLAEDPGAARVAFARAVAIADEHHLVQEEVVAAYTESLELSATTGSLVTTGSFATTATTASTSTSATTASTSTSATTTTTGSSATSATCASFGSPGSHDATAEIRRLRATARTLGRRFPAHEGAWLRAEGLLLAREGHLAAALKTLGRARDVFRERGMRHALARTHEALAALCPDGDDLAVALDLYRATGAAADAQRLAAARTR